MTLAVSMAVNDCGAVLFESLRRILMPWIMVPPG
jgi:hypothetical protein